MKRNITILFVSILILFTNCEAEKPDLTEQKLETVNSGKVLTIGIVPQFSSKRILSIWSPIIDKLEKETGYTINVVGTPSIPKFEAELNKGTFDLAYCNPYHSVVANKNNGYEAILCDGSKQLFGVLVVRKEDEIKNIKALDGEIISFPAPNALGASLLMRTELKQIHNLDIKPRYVKTHTNVYLNVIEGKTRAGGGVMRTFNELSDDIKKQLNIFYTTQKVPSHPIVVHPRVSPEIVTLIKQTLLKMGENEAGKIILSKIPINEITATDQKEYEVLKNLGMEAFYVESN